MRILRKVDFLKNINIEHFKILSDRNNENEYILKCLISAFDNNYLHSILSGSYIPKDLSFFLYKYSKDTFLQKLNLIYEENKHLFNKSKNEKNKKRMVFDFFNRGDAVVIDFETTEISIENIKENKFIIERFFALDLRDDTEIDNNFELLIEKINNRLVVCHNAKFDYKCLENYLLNNNYVLVKRENIVSSKQKNIIEFFEFKKGEKVLRFFLYDTMNIFPIKLSDVSKIISNLSNKNLKYFDKLNQKGVFISKEIIEKNNIDLTNIAFEEREDSVYIFNAVEIKKIVNQIKDKEIAEHLYKTYNKNDVYITAAAFLYYTDIYEEVFKINNLQIKLERKLTLPSLSYDILIYLSALECIDIIEENKIEMLSYKIIKKNTEKIIYKLSRKGKQIKEGVFLYRKSIFYLRENEILKIHFTRLKRKFKTDYKGGKVFIEKTGNWFYSDDKKEIRYYDINSCYPFSMSIIEVNPYVKLFEFNDLKTCHDFVENSGFVKNKSKNKIINEIINLDENKMIEKNHELKKLFEYAVDGSLSLLFEGKIKFVHNNNFGYFVRIKNGCQKTLIDCFGDFSSICKKDVLINCYDIIASNIEIDFKKIYLCFNRNKYLKEFIETLYKKRLEFKKMKNSFEVAIKLVLNSIYGKLGSGYDDEEKEVIHTIISDKFEIPKELILSYIKDFFSKSDYKKIKNVFIKKDKKTYKIKLKRNKKLKIICFPNKCKFCLIFKNKRIYYSFVLCDNGIKKEIHITRKIKHKILTKNNVLMALLITAYARLLLISYGNYFIKRGGYILYTDTDSIKTLINKNFFDNNIIGDDLGQLKFEGRREKFIVGAKKMYADEITIKCKGIGKEAIKNFDINKDINIIECIQIGKKGNYKIYELITKRIKKAVFRGCINIKEIEKFVVDKRLI